MAVGQAIAEHDVVALAAATGRWPVGTSGTVVSDYDEIKLIEISDPRGQTLDLVQVSEGNLDLVAKHSF